MLSEAEDFRVECDALADLLATLPDSGWSRATRFKGWSVEEVLVHLHFWNRAADLALTDEAGFAALLGQVVGSVATGRLRDVENRLVSERGAVLFAAWRADYADIAVRWQNLDPKRRVKWAGPDMSVRSSMTARQMETWAHGQAVFDLLGIARPESDRIRNIVVLGVNTYGWGFKVRGREQPGPMPRLVLTAPSGAIWHFGEADGHDEIRGAAVDFCRVVTQTRNIVDTGLVVTGEIARDWMANAQCFAGPPESPPAPGMRG